jgi:hypothetical protein
MCFKIYLSGFNKECAFVWYGEALSAAIVDNNAFACAAFSGKLP